MSQIFQNRVNKILHSRDNITSLSTALDTVGNFYKDYTQLSSSDIRRTLRNDLEKQNVEIAHQFVLKFESLENEFEKIKSQVHELDLNCQSIRLHLESTEEMTNKFAKEAKELKTKKSKLEKQVKELKDFMDKYQLTDSEFEILRQGQIDEENGPAFFSTIKKSHKVKEACKELLSTPKQEFGLELLDSISSQQEQAYERLYNWTKEACSNMNEDPNVLLSGALICLRERAAYYSHCKEIIILSRRSSVVHKFVVALTRGTDTTRPIEMHAHDPMRYSGDMLAWVHQAVATEKEYISSLLSGDTTYEQEEYREHEEDAVESSKDNMDVEDMIEISNTRKVSMIGKVFDGVARPLHVRIEQILIAQHGIVIAYRLENLLNFYYETISKLIGNCALLHVLDQCLKFSNKSLHDQLNQLTKCLTSTVPEYTTDLSPLHITMDMSHRLTEIIKIHQTSYVIDPESTNIDAVIETILEAIVNTCKVASEGLDITDSRVFLINNIVYVENTLNQFEEGKKKVNKIRNMIEQWISDLKQEQAKQVFQRCTVGSLLNRVRSVVENDIPSQKEGLDRDTVSSIANTYCGILKTLVFPSFDRIQNSDLRENVRNITVRELANVHEEIYDFIHDPKNGYENPDSIIHSNPALIRTLLEID